MSFVRRRLERLESTYRLKLESNLAEMRRSFAQAANELLARLSEQMSYIRFGELSSSAEFESAVDKMEHALDELEHRRGEMRHVLDRYEAELRLSTAETVLRLDELDDLSAIDSSRRAQAISASLSGRDLEAAGRALIGRIRSSGLVSAWERYEVMLAALNSRLEHTLTGIQRDLGNVDKIVTDDRFDNHLFSAPRLYEPTVNEMLENKRAFEEFEVISSRLSALLDENIDRPAQ